MRILILGGDGMLGHQLLLNLSQQHDVRVSLRQSILQYADYKIFNQDNSFDEVDIRDLQKINQILKNFKPDAVINAVGIVKQRKAAKEIIPSLEVNALFPHQLALLCKQANARLIHMSTDCIFSGRRGHYTEDDVSDAEDIYGRTKYLGELHEPHCFTIRSSIIGLELSRKAGLIEWFLAQRGAIKGYANALFTGLTTLEMSRVIARILTQHADLSGVWQVTSEKINKYELLTRFSKLLHRTDVSIEADTLFHCDRSLSGEKFEKVTGYKPPSWESLLTELAEQIKKR